MDDLVGRLELPPSVATSGAAGEQQFPVKVPPAWLAQVQPGRGNDPLLRQVLATPEEATSHPDYRSDAVGDLRSMAAPGVIHKYRGRVLLVATGACAVHCRYCFRRHFPYGAATASANGWRDALTYLGERPAVTEVILSGGDPLMLDTPKLARLTRGLRLLPHVRRLRIHTRIPVALPSRIDADFVHWLEELPLQKVVVIHVNHPAELGPEAREALTRLRDCGATLLNQSVLLADINDEADVLCELSESLFAAGVMPYYLHLLDRVEGAAHFEVPESRAIELMREVRARLSGFLVPRLVREREGEPYKLPVL